METTGTQGPIPSGLILPASQVFAVVGQGDTILVRPKKANRLYINVEVADFRYRQGQYNAATFVDGNVSVPNNTVNINAHTFDMGEGPHRLTSGGVLPAGLSLTQDVWIAKIDANNIGFAATLDAIARIEDFLNRGLSATALLIDITAAAGGGTHTVNAALTQASGAGHKIDGQQSTFLGVGRHEFVAPRKSTLKGSAAGSICNYWYA